MEKSFNLINNGIVQPTSGIVFLCKQDKKTEREVQEEFRKLLAPDEGNIKVRQGRIHMFVDAINELCILASLHRMRILCLSQLRQEHFQTAMNLGKI